MRNLFRAVLVPLAICASVHAAKPVADKPGFLRYTADKATGAAKLEVAIATLTNNKGQQVDLVSAVHVGDAKYYQDLNAIFQGYDAVLYEMVKPAGADVPRPGAEPGGAIGGMQLFLTRALDLTYQLDQIDYTPKNFVHADLDYETFERRMAERGESFFSIMMRAVLNDMARPKPGRQVNADMQLGQLLLALQAPDRPRQLKLLLGEQFQNMEEQVALLEGPEGSVILSERNTAALKVLRDELAHGKKKLAIFYGAAHLQGMQKDMIASMGFKPTGQKWLVAWDIPPAAKVVAPPATKPAMAR